MKTKIEQFIGKRQLAVVAQLQRGEEGKYFKDKIKEIGELIEKMPGTREQDGKGDAAIVYLHYFGRGDWYILEKDTVDGEPQLEAFGFADLGFGWGAELGYISIQEVIDNHQELDFHFEPMTVGELKKKGLIKPQF